jgi:hypothetical protein
VKKVTEIITVPEGKVEADFILFEDKDKIQLLNIYKAWIDINNNIKLLDGRKINIPELLSEGYYCLYSNSLRLKKINKVGVNSSWDCYNLTTKKRIQVKATSIDKDITSFGPKSVWDILIFCDFSIFGQFSIYEIPSKLVLKQKVNKHQTLEDQQKQGKRPRFCVKEKIIKKNNIKPINVIKFTN